MNKKIDSLFALSVLVLVLGVFALACSWIPFQGKSTVSDNVAKAEEFPAVVSSDTDFVWASSGQIDYSTISPLVRFKMFGFGLPDYNEWASVFSGSISGRLHLYADSSMTDSIVEFTYTVGDASSVGCSGQFASFVFDWYETGGSGHEQIPLYVGCNEESESALNSVLGSVYGLNCNEVTDNCFIDFSQYFDSTLTTIYYKFTTSEGPSLLQMFMTPFYGHAVKTLVSRAGSDSADLQNQLNLLQSKYNSLLISYQQVQNDYSSLLGDISRTSLGVLGDYSSLSLIQGSSGAGVDYSYVGPQGVSTVSWVDYELRKFSSTYIYLTRNKRYWYSATHTPRPQQDTVFVGCMLGLRRNFPAGAILNISMPEVTTSKAYVGVFDSVRNVIEYKATLSSGTSLNFVLLQNREFTLNDKLVFYFDFNDLDFVETDYFYDITWQLSVFFLDTQKYYDVGYTAGYTEGQNSMQGAIENARHQGFVEAQKMFDNGNSDYSFFGLISAVIDAPIKAVRGLLNFDILGVNMFSFVTSLFSLAVVLMIVKLLLGTRDIV